MWNPFRKSGRLGPTTSHALTQSCDQNGEVNIPTFVVVGLLFTRSDMTQFDAFSKICFTREDADATVKDLKAAGYHSCFVADQQEIHLTVNNKVEKE